QHRLRESWRHARRPFLCGAHLGGEVIPREDDQPAAVEGKAPADSRPRLVGVRGLFAGPHWPHPLGCGRPRVSTNSTFLQAAGSFTVRTPITSTSSALTRTDWPPTSAVADRPFNDVPIPT